MTVTMSLFQSLTRRPRRPRPPSSPTPSQLTDFLPMLCFSDIIIKDYARVYRESPCDMSLLRMRGGGIVGVYAHVRVRV